MILSKIGKRGQITLPKHLRTAWGVDDGDQVVFLQRGDDVVVRPLKQTLRDLRGSVPARESTDPETIRQQVKRMVAGKVAARDG
jgi:AbrB family looped-hinge helix DNA binding protein